MTYHQKRIWKFKKCVTSFVDNPFSLVPIIFGRNQLQESILQDFVFLHFPIFAVKLLHFVTYENNAITIKWSSSIVKNWKKCSFYEENSLVGLTRFIIALGKLSIFFFFFFAQKYQFYVHIIADNFFELLMCVALIIAKLELVWKKTLFLVLFLLKWSSINDVTQFLTTKQKILSKALMFERPLIQNKFLFLIHCKSN